MKRVITHVLAGFLLITLLPCTVFAKGIEGEPSKLTNPKVISIDTQQRIYEFEKENPYAITYLEQIKEACATADLKVGESVDQIMSEAMLSVKEVDQKNAEENYKKNSIKARSQMPRRSEMYNNAIANYAAGIAIVRACGCKNTAHFMEHALVPENSTTNPSDLYYGTNDDLTKSVYFTKKLHQQIFGSFERNILAKNLSSGTITGTYYFQNGQDDLDLVVGLGHINYSTTFVKKANGYSISFYVRDTYDFDWNRYENIAIDFANNYCYMMQQMGYIKEFDIIINYYYYK